ncbi:hypothetical protein D3C78_1673050 [compost metagenome]
MRLNALIHLDGRAHTTLLAAVVNFQTDHLADRHALEDHLGLAGLDPVAAGEIHLNLDTGLVVGAPAEPAANQQGNQR